MKKAVVLLSGGLDSTTTLYYAKSKGYRCRCLIFDYGQRHGREIKSARRIAQGAKCHAQVIRIKLPWKGSSLLDRRIEICHSEGAHSPSLRSGSVQAPRLKNLKERFFGVDIKRCQHLRMTVGDIPSTYVPARNIIFLSFALSCAEAIGAKTIFIGANAIDYSGYPDCRPEFFRAFQQVIKTGTKTGVRVKGQGLSIEVEAPLIKKSKKEIVKLAKRLKVPLGLTWSCYRGDKRPCGVCDSCVLRAKGFKGAGMEDPLYGSEDN